jgi:hypothetical protein
MYVCTLQAESSDAYRPPVDGDGNAEDSNIGADTEGKVDVESMEIENQSKDGASEEAGEEESKGDAGKDRESKSSLSFRAKQECSAVNAFLLYRCVPYLGSI